MGHKSLLTHNNDTFIFTLHFPTACLLQTSVLLKLALQLIYMVKTSDRWKGRGRGRGLCFLLSFTNKYLVSSWSIFLWMGWVTALAWAEITVWITSKSATQRKPRVCKSCSANTPHAPRKGWRQDHQKAAFISPPRQMHPTVQWQQRHSPSAPWASSSPQRQLQTMLLHPQISPKAAQLLTPSQIQVSSCLMPKRDTFPQTTVCWRRRLPLKRACLHCQAFIPPDSGWFGTNPATQCCAKQHSQNWKAVCTANSETGHFSVAPDLPGIRCICFCGCDQVTLRIYSSTWSIEFLCPRLVSIYQPWGSWIHINAPVRFPGSLRRTLSSDTWTLLVIRLPSFTTWYCVFFVVMKNISEHLQPGWWVCTSEALHSL